MTALDREPVAPAFVHVPPRAGSLGEQVTAVCASVGRIFDAEQRQAVDVLTSVGPTGAPAALEAAVISARQNLKTFVLEGITLTKMVEPDDPRLPPVRLGIWSAHLFETAQETFRNFDELISGYPHLSRRVLRVGRENGAEEFEFRGGRRLKFRARSKSGGRGLSGDFIVLDEAFALLPGHMGALLPTLSTRRRAQVLYGSSAGLPGSAVLRGVRDRGRAGQRGAPAYIEWCAPRVECAQTSCQHIPDTPGCVLDREDLWLLANPAAGRRITFDYLRAERRALPPDEFARERLGWWDDPADDVESFLTAWLACADPAAVAVGRPVFAVDVSPGSRSAAIAAATRQPDRRTHLELVEHRPNTDWLVRRCVELHERNDPMAWVIDPAGPVGSLLPDLAAQGIEPVAMRTRDLGQACEALSSLAGTTGVVHPGDPILTAAISGAGRRDIGDGLWAWSRRKSGTDICPLVAATEAHWLLSTQPAAYDLMQSFY